MHLAPFLSCPLLKTYFLFFSSGEFVVVNKHLLHDLTETSLWTPVVKNKIIHADGSVQNIPEIPHKLKAIYRYGLLVISDTFLSISSPLFSHYLFSMKLKYIFVSDLLGLFGKLSKKH